MEVRGQVHGLDMSSPQEEPPVPTPEPVWTIRRREKSLTPSGIEQFLRFNIFLTVHHELTIY